MSIKVGVNPFPRSAKEAKLVSFSLLDPVVWKRGGQGSYDNKLVSIWTHGLKKVGEEIKGGVGGKCS